MQRSRDIYYEYITIIQLTAQLFTDDGQHMAVLATHIGKVAQIKETVDACHT